MILGLDSVFLWGCFTSLKPTASLPLKMDAWEMIVFRPWVSWPIFRCELLVSGSYFYFWDEYIYIYIWSKQGVVILDSVFANSEISQFFLPWPFFELLIDQK